MRRRSLPRSGVPGRTPPGLHERRCACGRPHAHVTRIATSVPRRAHRHAPAAPRRGLARVRRASAQAGRLRAKGARACAALAGDRTDRASPHRALRAHVSPPAPAGGNCGCAGHVPRARADSAPRPSGEAGAHGARAFPIGSSSAGAGAHSEPTPHGASRPVCPGTARPPAQNRLCTSRSLGGRKPRIARAIVRSSGRVTLMLRASPSTTTTCTPSRSTSPASSVLDRSACA